MKFIFSNQGKSRTELNIQRLPLRGNSKFNPRLASGINLIKIYKNRLSFKTGGFLVFRFP